MYCADRTPTHVDFLVNGRQVKSVPQSPGYPLQLMLGVDEFGRDDDFRAPQQEAAGRYPKEFIVDHVRAFRR